MNTKLQTIVVVALLVGQVGAVTAATDGAYAPSGVKHDGETEGAGSIPMPASSTEIEPPRSAGGLAADLADALDGVLPGLLIPALGYSRHDDSDPLENETRSAVYEAVVESPGTYIAQIAADSGVSTSTVRYHVRILEEEGLVETDKIRGKRRVFGPGEAGSEIETVLNDDVTASLLEAIDRREPASVSTLGDALDRSPSTISYHLSRLEESGAIDRERDGERVMVSLTAATRTRLDEDSTTGE